MRKGHRAVWSRQRVGSREGAERGGGQRGAGTSLFPFHKHSFSRFFFEKNQLVMAGVLGINDLMDLSFFFLAFTEQDLKTTILTSKVLSSLSS